MNDSMFGIVVLLIALAFVVVVVLVFEQNKKDLKERIMSERKKYDEAFKLYLDDPLNNDCPVHNPEIWRRVYDWL